MSNVLVHPYYDPAIKDLVAQWKLFTWVDILVVVDGSVSTDPVNDFGVYRVIELIRGTKIGCMRFRVDIARRNPGAPAVDPSPALTEPKYTGFRFDMQDDGADVIDRYEQIWCFGFFPSNSGSANDGEIDQAFAVPATDAELRKLDQWMAGTRRGGVFGTGDHHFLGASMCRKIPRLGTMRRWTNADGVPPQFTTNRIDTLRPPSLAYYPGANPQQSMNNTPHQGDLTVQPIDWVAEDWHWISFLYQHRRPHPVLCHPTLGPIDVMPDHAHEGLCVPAPDLAANKKFTVLDPGTGTFVNSPEYPDALGGGSKPAPKIIAYGSNLGQPPFVFGKGLQPARTGNPMIAVYDGHPAGVGRVATDSTWHHWMDVNIDNLRLADNDDWKKIKRYFQNLAVWLNPPGYSTNCFYHAVVASHFEVVGFQEYFDRATVLDLGIALRHHLHYHWGPCWVTERVYELVIALDLVDIAVLGKLREKLRDAEIDGPLLEAMVLGQMVRATLEPANRIKRGDDDDCARKVDPLPPPEKLFAEPVRAGLREFAQLAERKCGEAGQLLREALT